MCQEKIMVMIITSSFVLPLPVQGIKICRRILDLDQRMPPVTRSGRFHKAEKSMTEGLETRIQEGEIHRNTKPLMEVRKGDLLYAVQGRRSGERNVKGIKSAVSRERALG